MMLLQEVTRRTCLAMRDVPVLGGLAAYAVRDMWANDRPGFARAGSPGEALQRRSRTSRWWHTTAGRSASMTTSSGIAR
jgi:hypothetical protein